MAKKKTVIQLVFLSGGKVLEKVTADALEGVIEIGKDASCSWRPTSGDMTMREHHARLTVKGDLDVRLEPIEGAPLTRNARPFAGGKLAPNDHIAVGDSEIQVREVAKVVVARERFHRLEGMNGELKGKLILMSHDPMTIGSAPDCDLVIKSDIVAPYQVELSSDEHGAVWIRDLGSRNGTFVNGERLTEKARMIKHADVIGVSIWDFRFLDRTVAHTRTNTARQLLLAAFTVGVCLAGYYAWRAQGETFREIGSDVIALLDKGDIDAAYNRFQDTYDTSDIDQRRETLAFARSRLVRWHNAWKDWELFKEIVRTGRNKNFEGVLDVMGRIRPDVAEDWSWQSEKTKDRMAEAAEGEAMMSLYFTVNKFLQGHVMTEAEFVSVQERFKKLGVEQEGWAEKDSREWIRPLREALADGARELRTYSVAIERVNAEVRKCGTSVEDLQAEVRRLEELEHLSTGYLRTFATTMLDPMSMLLDAAVVVSSNAVLISACEPQKVTLDLVLPTPDECLINSRVGEIRQYFVQRQAETKLLTARLTRALRLLDRAKVSAEEYKLIEPLLHVERWRSLVKEDPFSVPPPSRKRTKPINDYDRYLGVEWMWGFIKQYPLSYPDNVHYEDINGAEFEPVVVRVLRRGVALQQAETILMAKPFDAYRKGTLAEIADRLHKQLDRSRICVQYLDQVIEEEKDSRAELIAYAARLMLTADKRSITPQHIKRLKELTSFRRVRFDAVEYDEDAPAGSEKVLKGLRAKLAEGIPGDVRVMPYWKALYPETAKDDKEKTKGEDGK